MAFGKRKYERVDFVDGVPVRIVGIDGTWSRHCLMIDASRTGARLSVDGPLAGIDITEFFLLLSSTGLAFRRCRTVRVAGDQLGIEFIQPQDKRPKGTIRNRAAGMHP